MFKRTSGDDKITRMYDAIIKNVDVSAEIVSFDEMKSIIIPTSYCVETQQGKKKFWFYIGIGGPLLGSEYMYVISTSNLAGYFDCVIYYPTLIDIASDFGVIIGTIAGSSSIAFSKNVEIKDESNYEYVYNAIKEFAYIVAGIILRYNETIQKTVHKTMNNKNSNREIIDMLKALISMS